jgi:hypothetical protein
MNQLHYEDKFECFLLENFSNEKERLLAILQRCLVDNHPKQKYKELLIYQLINKYSMNKDSISKAVGINSRKIESYMYKQIIPKTNYQLAHKLKVKPLIQAIYLNSLFQDAEKILLTELVLEKKFKRSDLGTYIRYRKTYSLFEDMFQAKEQTLAAIRIHPSIADYWKRVPHPPNYMNIPHNEDARDHNTIH